MGSNWATSSYARISDVEKDRAANDGMDRRETKAKNDADGKTLAIEPTRASLACVRRAFANIEAMTVVKREKLTFRTGKRWKKRPRGGVSIWDVIFKFRDRDRLDIGQK